METTKRVTIMLTLILFVTGIAISDETKINLVMNNDRLSFSEAFRIKKKIERYRN